jgi:hypothetical protein
MEGSCHCGAVRWRFEGVPDSATACNCSICRRYGTLWAYGFYDERMVLSGPTQTYLWGSKGIEFHFCAQCGCVVCWRAAKPGADGRRWGAVNLRLADDPTAVLDIPLRHHDTDKDDLPLDGMHIADVWA